MEENKIKEIVDKYKIAIIDDKLYYDENNEQAKRFVEEQYRMYCKMCKIYGNEQPLSIKDFPVKWLGTCYIAKFISKNNKVIKDIN